MFSGSPRVILPGLWLLATGPVLATADVFLSLGPGDSAGGGSIAPAPAAMSPGGFDIVINPGATLAANAPALAAFERAAATWESLISDPITVTIDADMEDLMDPFVIGQASSVSFSFAYDDVRNALVADAMGNVAETATANIFMVRDGEVFTPVHWLGVGVLVAGLLGLAVYHLVPVQLDRPSLVPALWLAYLMIRAHLDGWVPYPFLDPALGAGAIALTIGLMAGVGLLVAAVLHLCAPLRAGVPGRRAMSTS